MQDEAGTLWPLGCKTQGMSANWDRNQKIQFYFGNAAKDLSDFLPPEEKSVAPSDLLNLLTEAETQILKIEEAQREISFLLSDLKRMIR